jgi:hypothetical protein
MSRGLRSSLFFPEGSHTRWQQRLAGGSTNAGFRVPGPLALCPTTFDSSNRPQHLYFPRLPSLLVKEPGMFRCYEPSYFHHHIQSRLYQSASFETESRCDFTSCFQSLSDLSAVSKPSRVKTFAFYTRT